MKSTITVRRLFDGHVHFRKGWLLYEAAPFTASYASHAVVMPNTKPRAILTGKDVIEYRDEIERVLDEMPQRPSFTPVMTFEIRDTTTPKMVVEAKRAGAVAGKIYPFGIYGEGLRDFFGKKTTDTFRAMQDVGMIRLIHGELDSPKRLFTQREEDFLPIFSRLAEKLPQLKTVLEHVSTEKGIKAVEQLGDNVAGSITAHHPVLTLNDARLNPHNICNPTPNRFEDRDALLKAMTSGNPKFFLGSDSAPHPREKKEGAPIACGAFTAPILPALLVEIFEQAKKLGKLEDFTSRFGAEFYGLPLNKETITLVKQEWVVPEQYGTVVPFRAGTTLKWRLV